MDLLAASEPFDRGYYAGPFGWISHGAAEFVVAIRSALVQPAAAPAAAAEGALQQQQQQQEQQQERAGNGDDAAVAGPQSLAAGEAIDPAGSGAAAPASVPATAELGSAPGTLVTLFAGVGIVRGSESAQEWAELDLKVRQYERLLQGVPPLVAAPNVNALWARLLVEELCRLGCNTFCVAPGEALRQTCKLNGGRPCSFCATAAPLTSLRMLAAPAVLRCALICVLEPVRRPLPMPCRLPLLTPHRGCGTASPRSHRALHRCAARAAGSAKRRQLPTLFLLCTAAASAKGHWLLLTLLTLLTLFLCTVSCQPATG
jgi:hypothetical protein